MTKIGALTVLFWAACAAVLIAAWRVFSRRPLQRIVSHEGLDDPEVAQGFNQMAKMPQMWLLRWYVARRAAQLMPQGQAVDLGCGPGHLVIQLAQLAPDLYVTGVDLSDEMVTEARRTANQAGVGNRIGFRKGDAAQIPFPDDSLDLVVSTLSLHHWGDPIRVLDEISRVLRRGGAFVVFDLRRDLSAPYYLLIWFVTRCVVPPALRRVNEPLASRNAAYTPGEAAHLATHSRLRGWRVVRGPLWLIIEGRKP
jgi:ubiquinone/menaquinone biosynthesis C-methylase UbiE